MKVKEIIDLLSTYPPQMEVFVPSNTGDYDYGRTYSVKRNYLTMPGGNIDAVVIDEC